MQVNSNNRYFLMKVHRTAITVVTGATSFLGFNKGCYLQQRVLMPVCLLYNVCKCVCMYVTDTVEVNRTTSMPKSVLHYVVDKDPTSVWYYDFTLSCFPNKKTGRQNRVKLFIRVGNISRDVLVLIHCCFSMKYWRNW